MPPDEPAVETGADFEPSRTGVVEGRALWDGELPQSPPISAWLQSEGGIKVTVRNPLVPMVNPESRAIADAVIFLRGVDPRKSKPWDHSAVVVEQRDYQIRILQGQQTGQVGFVRRGDEIEMVSRQEAFHSLHLSGAEWTTLAFPDPDVVRRRALRHSGMVELASNAGYWWARGFLFVDDHPYYAHTDEHGYFRLEQVPAGDYELVCWLPGWKHVKHTRDPESALITRTVLEPPLEVVRNVMIEPNATSTIRFAVQHESVKP
jgi:hypothetical protein